MTKIKLRMNEAMAVERERYELVKEITKMMFQDGMTLKGIEALSQVAEMIRARP